MACKPVVVCGHGPSGATLTLYLAKHKIPVVWVEKDVEPSRDSHPTTLHPPELEMMDAVGLAEACIANGVQLDSWQHRQDLASGAVAEFRMSALAGEVRFPFDLQLERGEMVRIARSKLKEDYQDLVDVRVGTRLNWIEQKASGVTVHVENSESVEALDACFVVGADGCSSTLRKLLGIGYSSSACDERFVVLSTNFRFEELGLSSSCYISHHHGGCADCVVVKTRKDWRIILQIDPTCSPTEEWVQARLHHLCDQIGPHNIGQQSLHTVQHRVADKFYKGRAVLVGSACCGHAPWGLDGGLGAVHGAWCVGRKLVKILKQGADHCAEFADYDQHWRPLAQSYIVDCKLIKQDHLVKVASDPVQAKGFVKEWATLKFARAAFKVSDHREVLEMPFLDAPVLPYFQKGPPAPADLEEQKRVASDPFKGRLGFGQKAAVLVIDFTRAYVTEGSPNYCGDPECGVVAAVHHTTDLLPLCRRKGVPIIFTRVLYDPNCAAQNGGVFVQKIPLLTSWKEGNKMCDIVPELPVCSGDHVLVKQYPSAFFGTPLAAMLTSLRVDTIVLVGCSTSGCIRATATDGISHGFRVIVPRECVGDRSPAVHDANLFDINLKSGDVVPKEGVVAHFQTLPDVKRQRLAEDACGP